MKIKLSNLEIDRIDLLSSFVHYTHGNESEIEHFFDQHNIDCDFDILNHKKHIRQFKVVIIVKINNDLTKPKPGYSIFSTMEGVFRVMKDVTDAEYTNLKLRSALPMMISSVRSQIYDLTSKLPKGPYLLPSIDLTDIIEQKKKEITSGTSKKKR